MEIRPPERQISVRGLKVWRIMGSIYSLLLWMIVVGCGVVVHIFDWPKWYVVAVGCLVLILTVMNIYIVPTIRWKRWRYEVREQEIELQHGVFVIERTLVPMVRVQHVDTTQGPLLRKYQLATISYIDCSN